MAHRQFVLLGIGGVIVLVVALTIAGLNDNLTYYLYPTEAVDQRSEFPDGERFRLAGLVVDGTLTEDGDDLRFDVTDGGATIAVVLSNTPPPLFDERVPVLVEGAWSGDVFVADSALIRHDENYEIPEEGGAYPDD
ncbi:MAG: cytochrome c maturation protein CcmE [Actinobacteria bacterium]|nr:cytochrome c maturation protein CcmE [Actinomycetota bacterium]